MSPFTNINRSSFFLRNCSNSSPIATGEAMQVLNYIHFTLVAIHESKVLCLKILLSNLNYKFYSNDRLKLESFSKIQIAYCF